MEKEQAAIAVPTTEQLRQELRREQYRRNYWQTLRSTVSILICVAAVAVLAATLAFPVLQVVGTSMEPTLKNGEIVLVAKNSGFKRGDVVAFYYNNKILLKRVIAFEGEYVDIETDGTVMVNDEILAEPYLSDRSFGECDIELPYQVPDGRVFVMGDHRATSVDSRSTTIGCISDESMVGKVLIRIWPFNKAGRVGGSQEE